jgi:hypothetical protein
LLKRPAQKAAQARQFSSGNLIGFGELDEIS